MKQEMIVPEPVTGRRSDVFKAWLVQDAEFAGKYEFPKVKACDAVPERAVPFDKAMRTKDKEQWVHFYMHDHRFACIWHNPTAYLAGLKQFQGVISPDFSLYRDMPLGMQIYNTYRSRAIGYWLQQNGVLVIPNVRWGDERTYDFCFDGIAKHTTVAVSTNGCIRQHIDREYFKQGLLVMVERLHPKVIVYYSNTPKDIFDPCRDAGVSIVSIENFHATVRKKVSD